jgi:hypothetical protein
MVSVAALVAVCWAVLIGLALAGVISAAAAILIAVGGYVGVAAVVCGLIGSARG